MSWGTCPTNQTASVCSFYACCAILTRALRFEQINQGTRVSTLGQSLSAQLDALKAAGADLVFREKVSGVRAERPQLAKLMAGLKPGDIVVVTELDRLGRSTRELLDLIERIGKALIRRAAGETLASIAKSYAVDISMISRL
jgi:Resolvase, N terminal domain